MPRQDEWLRAAEAVAMLKPILGEYSARLRICERAHGGLISARADQFHQGQRVFHNHDIPKEFWWAEGHEALEQDWAVGDFSTWLDQRIHLRAFGVTFDRADIEKLLPPQERAGLVTNEKLDPWGPISAVLYELSDADFLMNAVARTGVAVNWRQLTSAESYSHGTRIRAWRNDVQATYAELPEDKRGPFVRIILKAMLERHDADQTRAKLSSRLTDIGWTISPEGYLQTEDALLSEQYFPPNSEHDAYVAIRDILGRAKTSLTVVDGYMGSTLLNTLGALNPGTLTIRLLTKAGKLKADFNTELAAFRKQHATVTLEIRTDEAFHDRFILIDGVEVYHVGASIKDAGGKAFMISRVQDAINVIALLNSVERAWAAATPYG
jgi:hypothetical protein